MKKTLLILALIINPLTSQADGPPPAATASQAPMQCSESNVGAVQCMAQKMCECKFIRKSEMAGTPDRFSWDCGILRPACLDYQNIEITKPYDGPQSVIIDKGQTTTH